MRLFRWLLLLLGLLSLLALLGLGFAAWLEGQAWSDLEPRMAANRALTRQKEPRLSPLALSAAVSAAERERADACGGGPLFEWPYLADPPRAFAGGEAEAIVALLSAGREPDSMATLQQLGAEARRLALAPEGSATELCTLLAALATEAERLGRAPSVPLDAQLLVLSELLAEAAREPPQLAAGYWKAIEDHPLARRRFYRNLGLGDTAALLAFSLLRDASFLQPYSAGSRIYEAQLALTRWRPLLVLGAGPSDLPYADGLWVQRLALDRLAETLRRAINYAGPR